MSDRQDLTREEVLEQLSVKWGAIFNKTTDAAPVQYEIETIALGDFYFRERHGDWKLCRMGKDGNIDFWNPLFSGETDGSIPSFIDDYEFAEIIDDCFTKLQGGQGTAAE